MEHQMRDSEQAMNSKMSRIDNELNLEVKDLKDALKQYQKETEFEKQELTNTISHLQQQIKQLSELKESTERQLLTEKEEL